MDDKCNNNYLKENLVLAIYNSIFVENIEIYKNLFETVKVGPKTTEYWKDTVGLYRKLSEEDRQVFLKVIEQTVVDTISNMLGAIDGSSTLENFESEINLVVDDQCLEDDLQDSFLEVVEKLNEKI